MAGSTNPYGFGPGYVPPPRPDGSAHLRARLYGCGSCLIVVLVTLALVRLVVSRAVGDSPLGALPVYPGATRTAFNLASISGTRADTAQYVVDAAPGDVRSYYLAELNTAPWTLDSTGSTVATTATAIAFHRIGTTGEHGVLSISSVTGRAQIDITYTR